MCIRDSILSVLWEIVSVFLGKFLYFITMVCGIGILYNGLPENEAVSYTHLFIVITPFYQRNNILFRHLQLQCFAY